MTSKKTKDARVKRHERLTLLLSEHEKACIKRHANGIGVSATAAIRLILAAKIVGFASKGESE